MLLPAPCRVCSRFILPLRFSCFYASSFQRCRCCHADVTAAASTPLCHDVAIDDAATPLFASSRCRYCMPSAADMILRDDDVVDVRGYVDTRHYIGYCYCYYDDNIGAAIADTPR